jgi:hypothetical protein
MTSTRERMSGFTGWFATSEVSGDQMAAAPSCRVGCFDLHCWFSGRNITMSGLTDIWTRKRISGSAAEEREASAQWATAPRQGTSVENIHSPNAFSTELLHYNALMAEAVARSEPTQPCDGRCRPITSRPQCGSEPRISDCHDRCIGSWRCGPPGYAAHLRAEFR